MNLYISFFYINTGGFYIGNGFSFGIERKKDDEFLFFSNLTTTKKIHEEIQKYNPEKIFCSLIFFRHLSLVEPLIDKRWIIGGPLTGNSYGQEVFKETPATVFQGSMENYLGKELSGDFLPYFKDFVKNNFLYGHVLCYNASVGFGCYWGKCKFCGYKELTDWRCNKIQERPNLKKILNDLPEFKENVNRILVHTCMDCLSPRTLDEVLSAKKSIDFMSFIRTDKLILDIIKKHENLSNHCFSIGVEGFSQRVVDELGKGIQIQTMLEIVESISERGGFVSINIMEDYPFLNKEDVKESFLTLDKIKQIKEKAKKGKVRINNNKSVWWPKEEDVLKYGFPVQRGSISIGGKIFFGNRYRSIIPSNSEQYQYNVEIMDYIRKCEIPMFYETVL